MKSRLSSYMYLTITSGLSQGILLLSSPIITRLYGPQEVGGFAVVLGFAALVGSVGTGRLEHAIPVARGPVDSIRIAFLGLLLVVLASAVSLVVVKMVPADMLSKDPEWQHFSLFAIPALALSLAFSQLVNALLLRQRAIRAVGTNKMLQGTVTGVAQVGFGLAAMGSSGLIWGQTIGYSVGALSGMRKLVARGSLIMWHRGPQIKETFGRYRRFPLTLAPAALFNLATQQLPILALGYLYGLYEAGLYALVMRACGGPLGMLGQAVAQVYASEFRSFLHKPGDALAREYLLTLARLLLAGIFIVGGIVFIMNFWGTWLFGARWANIGTVTTLLSLMLLSVFVTTPVSMTLGYLGQAHIQLAWDAGRFVAMLLLVSITYFFSLSFGKFLVMLAAMWSLSLFIHALLTLRACRLVGAGTKPEGVSQDQTS